MEIFKTLMISRGLGLSTESVKALNIIEVVFSDDQRTVYLEGRFVATSCAQ